MIFSCKLYTLSKLEINVSNRLYRHILIDNWSIGSKIVLSNAFEEGTCLLKLLASSLCGLLIQKFISSRPVSYLLAAPWQFQPYNVILSKQRTWPRQLTRVTRRLVASIPLQSFRTNSCRYRPLPTGRSSTSTSWKARGETRPSPWKAGVWTLPLLPPTSQPPTGLFT